LAGRERVKWLANGARVTQSYDAAGRVVGVDTGGPAGPVRRLTYTLDSLGRRGVIAASDGSRTTYGYDAAGQVVRERRARSGIDATHAYDPAGNRVLHVDSGARTTFSYDAANQLTVERTGSLRTSYAYDAAGNRLRKDDPASTTYYAWDARGRLSAAEPVGGRVSFGYDGTGRRATKQSDAGSARYVWDFRKLLQECDGDGLTENQYLSTEGEYGNLVSGYGDGSTRYYGFDALGSTEVLLDDTGSVSARFEYRAFGLTGESGGESPGLALPAPLPSELGGGTSASTGEPFAFVGRQNYYRDSETDLYFLGAGGSDSGLGRYYDPAAARFLSKDPIEQAGGHDNLYLYCANDPVNQTDPSGNRVLRGRIEIGLYGVRASSVALRHERTEALPQ
jgi:RHS repeat-associated protein